MTEELPFCECGGGERVTRKGNRFINGHNFQGKYHTPETCAKMSEVLKNSDAVKAKADAQRGVPLSPKHCDAISAGTFGVPKSPRTPEHIAALENHWENMRGGNDIVDHHAAYDFGRPDALIVKITRKFHGAIHHPKDCKFGTYGYSLID